MAAGMKIGALQRWVYDQGITFFDFADIYGLGKAEAALGEVLKHPPGLRKHIVIQSKCGHARRDIGQPPHLLEPAADAAPEVKRTAQLLADLAQRHDATPAAIMLAWLLRHPAGIVPILGTSRPERVIENCAADRVELSRAEWYALLQAAAALPAPRP